MTLSSAQLTCLNTSTSITDTITVNTVDLSNITLTYPQPTYSIGAGSGTTSYYSAGATVGSMSGVTISTIDTSTWNIKMPEEWVNCFPDFDRVKKMCEEYPGLAIAYEKFVTTYKLVKDDYDTPKDKRPRT